MWKWNRRVALVLLFVVVSVAGLTAQSLGQRWNYLWHDVILFVWDGSAAVKVNGDASGNIGTFNVDLAGVSNSFAAQSAVGATSALVPTFIPQTHTAQLIVTGGPTGCTYRLQGSNDGGATWFNISAADITCTTTTSSFEVNKPGVRIRGNLLTLTGGTTPTVTLHYAGR